MTPRRILGRLWTLEKGGETLNCLVVAAAEGEELRVMKGADEVYVSEPLPNRVAVLRQADAIRLDHQYRGWLRNLTPGMGGPAVPPARARSRGNNPDD